MSLIFSALKTMENAEAGTPDLLDPAPRPRRPGRWRLLAALGVMAIVAGGVVLLRMTPSGSPVAVTTKVASASMEKKTVASTQAPPSEAKMPPPVPVKDSAPPLASEPTTVSAPQSTMTRVPKLAAMTSPPVGPSVATQVPPRSAAMPSDKTSSAAQPVIAAVEKPAEKKSVPASTASEPVKIAIKARPRLARVETAAASSTPRRVTAKTSLAEPDQPEGKSIRVALVNHPAPVKSVPVNSDAAAGQPQASDTAESAPPAEAAVNKEVLARRHLSVQVSTLMSDFRVAIASGKMIEAKQKLRALKQIASPDSLTLLRARAYWALTQGQMDKAMDRYRAILQRVPADHDAMLNLTVAEWQGGQKADAMARIETLAKRFPGDSTIQRYLRVMEGR